MKMDGPQIQGAGQCGLALTERRAWTNASGGSNYGTSKIFDGWVDGEGEGWMGPSSSGDAHSGTATVTETSVRGRRVTWPDGSIVVGRFKAGEGTGAGALASAKER